MANGDYTERELREFDDWDNFDDMFPDEGYDLGEDEY